MINTTSLFKLEAGKRGGRATVMINRGCLWVLRQATAFQLYDGITYLLGVDGDNYRYDEDQNCWFQVCPATPDPLFTDALAYHEDALPRPWLYELVGPDIKGNPEKQPRHVLWAHGRRRFVVTPIFETVRRFLAGRNIAGLEFWEDPDDYNSRKCYVLQSHFGFRRNTRGDT